MTPSQSIFQSASWEELAEAMNTAAMRKSMKRGGSYGPNTLVKVVTARVRYLRRYRLTSTIKSKLAFDKCYASDLLSHSTNTVIGKVLMSPMDRTKTLHPDQSISGTFGNDDMSDISMSSEEDEDPDYFKNSSLEYVWIFGMRFVVFDSSISNSH